MAKGSHTTWGAYDSKTCCLCGRPIRITIDSAWIHHENDQHRSVHTACGTPLPEEDRR